jgi:2-dehydropantoate 2-reductase
MRILVYGAGAIGQWLALHLSRGGEDVTLLARGATSRRLRQDGIRVRDGLTGERLAARVPVVEALEPTDEYDLAIVAMSKAGRLAVSSTLGRNDRIPHVLFLGNDVAGAPSYADHLSGERLLLGFPGSGGGWIDDDLVVLDREKAGHARGPVHLGEIDGLARDRTRTIAQLLERCGISARIRDDMDGWLKYHFAFMAPTAGVIVQCGGPKSVAEDADAIHRYCRACREAGNVLRAVGHRRRQPFVFNLYYWTPRWLEPVIFGKLFNSRMAEIGFGLHLEVVGPELRLLAREFAELRARSTLKTPELDALLACVSEHAPEADPKGDT